MYNKNIDLQSEYISLSDLMAGGSHVVSAIRSRFLLTLPPSLTSLPATMSTVEKINSDKNGQHKHILCKYYISQHDCAFVDLPRSYTAHATKVPGLIFLSGQTPVASNGQVIPGGIKEHVVCDTGLDDVGTAVLTPIAGSI